MQPGHVWLRRGSCLQPEGHQDASSHLLRYVQISEFPKCLAWVFCLECSGITLPLSWQCLLAIWQTHHRINHSTLVKRPVSNACSCLQRAADRCRASQVLKAAAESHHALHCLLRIRTAIVLMLSLQEATSVRQLAHALSL